MPNKNTGPDYLDYTGQEDLNKRLRKRRQVSKTKTKKAKELEKRIKKLQESKSKNIA